LHAPVAAAVLVGAAAAPVSDPSGMPLVSDPPLLPQPAAMAASARRAGTASRRTAGKASKGRIRCSAVMPISTLLRGYEQVILDLDGCVWIGPDPIPGSLDAINAIREAGMRLAFVTNNSWMAGEDLVTKLWGIGVRASLADVVTVGGAMQHLLADTRQGRTAFVIGSEAMFRHVQDAGLRIMNGTDLASRAEVVVIGATFDLTYDDLKNASLAARRGADLLATGRDPTLPMPDGFWPGTGSVLSLPSSRCWISAYVAASPRSLPAASSNMPSRSASSTEVRGGTMWRSLPVRSAASAERTA